MASTKLLRDLDTAPPWLMGIINLTPDSFTDGGMYRSAADALTHAEQQRAAGAAILDIGGESTRPGSLPVPAEEELRRISAVVAELAPRAFLSIDTYKASVARHCLERGARMINDTSALRADLEMAKVVKEHDAYVVLMHSKETGRLPHATRTEKRYVNLVKEVAEFLCARVDTALAHGIDFDRIIIDPGFGAFLSMDPQDSWRMLAGLDTLQSYGLSSPILVGISRKGFLGGEVPERDPVSQLAGLAAVRKGALILRTHNVAMAKSFFQAWSKIYPEERQG